MDQINHYSTIIKEIFQENSVVKPANKPTVDYQVIIDNSSHHFILSVMGWHNKRYINNTIFQLQIKEDKIWIYEDNADPDIVIQLLKKGIPLDAIVLGYRPEYARKPLDVLAIMDS